MMARLALQIERQHLNLMPDQMLKNSDINDGRFTDASQEEYSPTTMGFMFKIRGAIKEGVWSEWAIYRLC